MLRQTRVRTHQRVLFGWCVGGVEPEASQPARSQVDQAADHPIEPTPLASLRFRLAIYRPRSRDDYPADVILTACLQRPRIGGEENVGVIPGGGWTTVGLVSAKKRLNTTLASRGRGP